MSDNAENAATRIVSIIGERCRLYGTNVSSDELITEWEIADIIDEEFKDG